jgi:signal transduction histidine kinase
MAMHEFLSAHTAELVDTCVSRLRPLAGDRSDAEIKADLPRILADVIRTMRSAEGFANSSAVAALTRHAATLGRQRQRSGFDIGLTALSLGVISAATGEIGERNGMSFTAGEYKTFNECIDAATASAITEFWQVAHEEKQRDDAKRLGFFAHELRNSLSTAMMAWEALRHGNIGVSGLTGQVLHRSLHRMEGLLGQTLVTAVLRGGAPLNIQKTNLLRLLHAAEADVVRERGVAIDVSADESLQVAVDERVLMSAIGNLLQNAVKFSRDGGLVQLRAFAASDLVVIEVEDECGGLPGGETEELFEPFVRGNDPRSTGLGLAITREAIATLGGNVDTRDLPGKGCVFRITLRAANPAPPVER